MEVLTLKSVVAKLEDLFDKFNERYYNNQLQKPIISVSPDSTKGAYGWCTTWKAWETNDINNKYYEINMCAEHLDRPFNDLCATLLHEMVHLYNLQEKIKDTSRKGTYHNKKFKETAEKHGLIIEQDAKYGWTITKLNDEAKEYIASLNESEFNLHRTKELKKPKSEKAILKKYTCPNCQMNVKSSKDIKLICGYCEVEMTTE